MKIKAPYLLFLLHVQKDVSHTTEKDTEQTSKKTNNQ